MRPDAEPIGTLGDPDLDRVVSRDALGELEAGLSSTRHYGEHGEAREEAVSVFIESFVVPPRMIIFGAVDFTAALASVAKLLGFRVTVCDARAVFATVLRFPMADEVVNTWPDRYLAEVGARLTARDVVCVLTHDHKFDVPAIVAAMQTKVGYIGAMGSRRTNEGRVVRLREAGLTDDDIARVMSPIGLDIGARTPEETAISICAEVIAARTGRRAGLAARHCRPDSLAAVRSGAMDLGIAGRRAAVAAASKGLGFAVAQALVAEGVRVAICGRDADTIEAAAATLGAGDGADRRRPLVARRARPGSSATRAPRSGGIDILVANAGGPPPGNFASVTRRSVPRRVRAQLPFDDRDVLRGGARRCAAQQWGRVVAITSIAVRQPIPTLILSNTARAGVTGFLKTLAREIAADGVTVNSLLPGLHATERIAALHGGGGDPAAGIPAGRDRRPRRLRPVRRVPVLGARAVRHRHAPSPSTAAPTPRSDS